MPGPEVITSVEDEQAVPVLRCSQPAQGLWDRTKPEVALAVTGLSKGPPEGPGEAQCFTVQVLNRSRRLSPSSHVPPGTSDVLPQTELSFPRPNPTSPVKL